MARVAEQQWSKQQQHERKKRETHTMPLTSKKKSRRRSAEHDSFARVAESCSLATMQEEEEEEERPCLPPGIHVPISPERELAIQLLIHHIFLPPDSSILPMSPKTITRQNITVDLRKEAQSRKEAFISRHWLKYGLPRKSFRFTGNFIDKHGFAGTHAVSKWGALWIQSNDTLQRLRDGEYIELAETRTPNEKLFLMYQHLEHAIELALPEEFCSFFVTLDPERCLCSAREWYEALEKSMYTKN